jgi:uncharacterized membrane protein YfcA
MSLLGLAFAGVIGLALGLLGGGGSILTVPVLVYVLGVAAKPAIAMSLPVVGLTSLVGAAAHWRLGNVRLATAALFGVLAMGGAFAGAKLSVFLSGAVQLVLLAVVMLAAAVGMLWTRRDHARAPSEDTAPARWSLLAPVAVAVGVLTGLVGVGGGFLIVPALVLLARVPMRQAVGTSLLVIALNSAAGFGGYIGTVDIDWAFLARFTAVTIAGALAGAAMASRVPVSTLRRAFAVFLLVVGGVVLYKNRSALGGGTTPESGRSDTMTSIDR